MIGAVAPLSAAPGRSSVDDEPPPIEDLASSPAEKVTLPSVLEVAVRRSPDLASASIDADIARAQVLLASGAEDWLLSASGTFARTKRLGFGADQDGDEIVVAGESDARSFEVGLSKLLPTGGTASVGGTFAENETQGVRAGMEIFEPAWSADARLRLDQPILRGFGSTAAFADRTKAEQEARAAELGKRAAAQNMIRDIVSAYWEVAFAHEDLAIRRSSLELARERRRLTQVSARLGQVAPTEIVAVDQIIAQRQEVILTAELAVSERSLELRRLAGMEIDASKIDLAPSEALAAEPAAPNLEAVLEDALDSSPELAALEARGRGARIEVEVAENGTLPRLDLGLIVGPSGLGRTLGDAFSSMTGVDGYEASASLRFEYGLGNSAARGRAQQAKAGLRRVKIDQRSLSNEITIAAVQSVKLAESARQRIALGATAITLSEKNVKAESGRFELGKSTNFDVLARQEELKEARLRRARAVVDYLRATAFIDALTGDILEKYGVKLED
jgi:outer membrane protein TolC